MRYLGPSVEEVIEELNLDVSCFEGKNMHGKGCYSMITEEMCKVVKELYNNDVRIILIAKYFDLSSTTVSKMINDSIIFTNEDDVRIDTGKICALYRARWSIQDIADDCHVTTAIVVDVLKNNL